jgi:hypothetical protein
MKAEIIPSIYSGGANSSKQVGNTPCQYTMKWSPKTYFIYFYRTCHPNKYNIPSSVDFEVVSWHQPFNTSFISSMVPWVLHIVGVDEQLLPPQETQFPFILT